MLPLGIVYFTIAVTFLSAGVALAVMPLVSIAEHLGWAANGTLFSDDASIGSFVVAEHSLLAALVLGVLGVLVITLLMHLARAIGRGHARLAKSLLVAPGA
jgi:Putative sensor